MKKCGAIGVARKPPHIPSYCHPLFRRGPPGAVVLTDASPVSNRITARAVIDSMPRPHAIIGRSLFTGGAYYSTTFDVIWRSRLLGAKDDKWTRRELRTHSRRYPPSWS